ncbi:hypothetical protein FHS85_000291 [Rhodoligotrophos appendicifer]|uniref:hypothetical protein n=1 Tax=Rhodoligotrophos appendicifer TaxID=987056 RepID=UPI00117FE5A8|nr:hypothetical protein [Rhodoligotrophos appendicifer]
MPETVNSASRTSIPAAVSQTLRSWKGPDRASYRFEMGENGQGRGEGDWPDVVGQKLSAAQIVLGVCKEDAVNAGVEPLAFGSRLAASGQPAAMVYSSLTKDVQRVIDKAALIYAGRSHLELSPSTNDLASLRESLLHALEREWQKSQMFLPPSQPGEGDEPAFNGFTFVNAAGSSFQDLLSAPSVMHIPGMAELSQTQRSALIAERLGELGINESYKVGTIEFTLASVVTLTNRALGQDVPENLGTRSELLMQFQHLVEQWQAAPEATINPFVFAAIHLAKSSGDNLLGANWKEKCAAAATYFGERWLANFGAPPSHFDRVEQAYSIMERESGWDDIDLEYEKVGFSESYAWFLTETKYMTPIERFLYLADMPGPLGKKMVLKCEHDVKHRSHVLDPQQLLQRAEEDHNKMVAAHPWIVARAKENLRLSGQSTSETAVDSEMSRIVGQLEAETESHRHLVSGLNFVKDWYISQIPIVGGIYNVEEGIRHGNIKQIIGGGLALSLEVGGMMVVGLRGGAVAGAELSPHISPQAGASSAMAHVVSELNIPRSELLVETAPARLPPVIGNAAPLGIELAGVDEIFSEVPPRFSGMQPGEKITYIHEMSGQQLVVTRVESTGETIALSPVSGQQGTFHLADWVTGEAVKNGELNPYHMDPKTGRIEPSGRLCGGGIGCSKPSRGRTSTDAEMEDPLLPSVQVVETIRDQPPPIDPTQVQIHEGASSGWRLETEAAEGPKQIRIDVASELTESTSIGLPSPSDLNSGDWSARSPQALIDSHRGVTRAEIHAGPEFQDAGAISSKPAMPIESRLADLPSKSADVFVQVPTQEGHPTAFWDAYPNLDRIPSDWGQVSEPVNSEAFARGPSLPNLRSQGQYVTDGVAGQAIAYDGEYWTVIGGDNPGQRAARTEIAVTAWNDQYSSYHIGHATAWDLGDGAFAMRTPAIPFREGYAKSLDIPRGTYGRPLVTTVDEISSSEVIPPPLEHFRNEMGDRAVVMAGGKWVGQETNEPIYWYKGRYWTFQEGETLQSRYDAAKAFVQNWNAAFSKSSGQYASVKILPEDEAVAVLTVGLPPHAADIKSSGMPSPATIGESTAQLGRPAAQERAEVEATATVSRASISVEEQSREVTDVPRADELENWIM